MIKFHKGSIVVSPHTDVPWSPYTVTEVGDLASGAQMLRIARLAKLGWMHSDAFLPAPKGTFDMRMGRWMDGDVNVTPKLADLATE